MPNDEFQKVIEELTTNQHRLMGSNFRPRGSEETLAPFTDLPADIKLPTKLDELKRGDFSIV
jgi:hypothetical protein